MIFPDSGGSIAAKSFKVVLGGNLGDYPFSDSIRELVFEDGSSEFVVWGNSSGGRIAVDAEFSLAQIQLSDYNELITYLNANKGSKIQLTLEDGEEVFGPLYPSSGSTAYARIVEVDPKGEGAFSPTRSIFEIRLKLAYSGSTANAELNGADTAKYDCFIKITTKGRGSDYIVADSTARLALSPSTNDFCFQQDNRTLYYYDGATWQTVVSTTDLPNPVPSYIQVILNDDDIGLNDGNFYLAAFTDKSITPTTGIQSPPYYKAGFINNKSIKFPGFNIDIEKGAAIERPEGFSFSLNNLSRFHIDAITSKFPFFGAKVELYQYDKTNAQTILICTGINIQNEISFTDYKFNVTPKYLFSSNSFPVDPLTNSFFPGADPEKEGDKIIQTYGRWDYGKIQELSNKTDPISMSPGVKTAAILAIGTQNIGGTDYQEITISIDPEIWYLDDAENLPLSPTLSSVEEYYLYLKESNSSEKEDAKPLIAYSTDTIGQSKFVSLLLTDSDPFAIKSTLTTPYQVNGAAQTGDFLVVKNGVGAVAVGDKFLIAGDATVYTIKEVNGSTWTIDPAISGPDDSAVITLQDLLAVGDLIQIIRLGVGYAIDSDPCIGFEEPGYLDESKSQLELFIKDDEGRIVKLPQGFFKVRDSNKNVIEFTPDKYKFAEDGTIQTQTRFPVEFIEPGFPLSRFFSVKAFFISKDQYKSLWSAMNYYYGANTSFDFSEIDGIVLTGWPFLINDTYPIGRTNPVWMPRVVNKLGVPGTVASFPSLSTNDVYRSNVWQWYSDGSGNYNKTNVLDTQIYKHYVKTFLNSGIYRYFAQNYISLGCRSAFKSGTTIAAGEILLQFGWEISTQTKIDLRNATSVKFLCAFQIEFGDHDDDNIPDGSNDWLVDGNQVQISDNLLDVKDGTNPPSVGDVFQIAAFNGIVKSLCYLNEWTVNGAGQTGTSLNVTGGTNIPPVLSRFTIPGDATVYTITNATATVWTITPTLSVSPSNGAIFNPRTWQFTTYTSPFSLTAVDNEAITFPSQIVDFSAISLLINLVGIAPDGSRTTLLSRNVLNKNYDLGTNYKDYYVFNNVPGSLKGNDTDYSAPLRINGSDRLEPVQISGSGNDGYIFNSKELFALDDSVFANDGAIFGAFSHLVIEVVNRDAITSTQFGGFVFPELTIFKFGWGSVNVSDRIAQTPIISSAFFEYTSTFDLLNKPAFARIDGGKIIDGGSTIAESPIEILQDILRQAPLIPDNTQVDFINESEKAGRDLWKWRAQFENEKDVKAIVLDMIRQMHAFGLIDESGNLILRSLDEDDHGAPVFDFDETNIIRDSVTDLNFREATNIYQAFKLRYHTDPAKDKTSKDIQLSYDSSGNASVSGVKSANQASSLGNSLKDRVMISKSVYSDNQDKVLDFEAPFFYDLDLPNVDSSGQPFNGVYKLFKKLVKFHSLNAWTITFKVNQKYFVYDSGVSGNRIKKGDLVTFKHYFYTNNNKIRGIVTRIRPNIYDGFYQVTIFCQNPPDALAGFHDPIWDGGIGSIDKTDFVFKAESYAAKDSPITGTYPDGGSGAITKSQYKFSDDTYADAEESYP